MDEILFLSILEGIGNLIRSAYYRIKYPNKYLREQKIAERAKKLAEKDDRIPLGSKVAGWMLVIAVFTILLILFYKLTGIWE